MKRTSDINNIKDMLSSANGNIPVTGNKLVHDHRKHYIVILLGMDTI